MSHDIIVYFQGILEVHRIQNYLLGHRAVVPMWKLHRVQERIALMQCPTQQAKWDKGKLMTGGPHKRHNTERHHQPARAMIPAQQAGERTIANIFGCLVCSAKKTRTHLMDNQCNVRDLNPGHLDGEANQ